MLDKKYIVSAGVGAALVASLGAGMFALADTSTTGGTGTTAPTATAAMMAHKPGVGGTVTAVSGNTITITTTNPKTKATSTYTVDASAAAITKDMTVSVGDIKVGDTIMADGTVNGTSVAATAIHDGNPPAGGAMGGPGMGWGGMGRGTMMGGMGVRGTVASVSGNTLTVTATNPKDSTTKTYTVDASSAQVLKGTGTAKPTASTLSSVAVGDTVMVAGTVSGQNITAKMIVDGQFPQRGPKPATTSTTSMTTQ